MRYKVPKHGKPKNFIIWKNAEERLNWLKKTSGAPSDSYIMNNALLAYNLSPIDVLKEKRKELVRENDRICRQIEDIGKEIKELILAKENAPKDELKNAFAAKQKED